MIMNANDIDARRPRPGQGGGAPVNHFFLDFETRSKTDLRKVGADNYARDPSTEVISISYAYDNLPTCHRARSTFDWPANVTYVAHNVEFERAILRHRYDIHPSSWVDTMALAAQLSLPL